MALGKIKADTLEHSTAGSIATNYVVNGSAKWWVNADNSGTTEVQGSFNNSSITDDGTGDTSFSYTNNMNDALYSVPHGGHYDDTNRSSMYFSAFNNLETSGVKCNTGTYSSSNVSSDIALIYASVFGDLA
jgi:hypothetical protein